MEDIVLKAGDVIELESGKTYKGMLCLKGVNAADNPVIIRSSSREKAVIDGAGYLAALVLSDCSGVVVENLAFRADGSGKSDSSDPKADEAVVHGMRCAILVKAEHAGRYSHLRFSDLDIRKIYYHDKGYVRSEAETRDGRSRSQYGWGIRFVVRNPRSALEKVVIEDCQMTDIAHTAVKFTGAKMNICHVTVRNNRIFHVGGPGIQMSGVKAAHVWGNNVEYSGSIADARNWGRGSGYWCWGSEDVIVEHNRFTHAHGPQDSAGAHIDFNNNNIIYQYNYSACNDGGFVEILGDNYNCMYRFNISVNDGTRTVGVNRAVSNGALFMLTGYVGHANKRHGPYHSYIYNNTIYVDESVQPKLLLEKTVSGVLIANNIFHVSRQAVIPRVKRYLTQIVPGNTEGILWKHNLYVHDEILPSVYQDSEAVYGNPRFRMNRGLSPASFVPRMSSLMKGVSIEPLPQGGEAVSEEIRAILNGRGALRHDLQVERDFMGNEITSPFMGAIRPE